MRDVNSRGEWCPQSHVDGRAALVLPAFLANDSAVTLAKGLRAALDATTARR